MTNKEDAVVENDVNKKTKILVKIDKTLLKILNEEMKNALLKRDAFLDNAIRHEIEALDKEITIKNSERAYDFLVKALSKNDLTPVNLNLKADTVIALNEICKEKKIPRDAFINRLILLITASQKVIDNLMPVFKEIYLGVPELPTDEGVEYFYLRPNTIDSIKDFVKISPLFLLRYLLDSYYESDDCDDRMRYGFYTQPYKPDMLKGDIFGMGRNDYEKIKNLSGFNVCLDDEFVSVLERQMEKISNKDEKEVIGLLEFIANMKQSDRSAYKKAIKNKT